MYYWFFFLIGGAILYCNLYSTWFYKVYNVRLVKGEYMRETISNSVIFREITFIFNIILTYFSPSFKRCGNQGTRFIYLKNSKTYQNLHIHMSVLSFKEVTLGGYTIIPMMLPLLKALLELSLEPSSYYFEYPQWWQIFVFWGWIWILETSKSHLEPSLVNKVGDQDGYCHFWSKIGCNYKIMRLIFWVIELCVCVLSHIHWFLRQFQRESL